jgi:DNA-binding CsgD family transcriptional regulator
VAALTDMAVRPGALASIVAAADSAPLIAFGGIAAVGAAWQSMRGGTIDARIELDLRLRRRAEGGLVVDGAGGAFGMAVRGPRGRTLVIPAATIDRVAGQLLAHGRVQIAYLGVGLKDVPLDDDRAREPGGARRPASGGYHPVLGRPAAAACRHAAADIAGDADRHRGGAGRSARGSAAGGGGDDRGSAGTLSSRDPAAGLRLAIRVDDPALAARLADILGRIPELRIVGADEASDLVLSAADASEDGFDLTPRERDVIALLAEGLSNKAIGQRLGISPDTAKFHVSRLIDKLDATGRTDAVAHAARRGIIHL